jgi:hypothetical protein
MAFIHNLVVSLTSPINGAANLLAGVSNEVVKFVGCVVTNIQGIV